MNSNNHHTIFRLSGVCLFIAALMACRAKTDAYKSQTGENESSMNMSMPTGDKNMPKMATGIDTSALLTFIIKPTNEYVRSGVPLVSLQKSREAIEVTALGRVAYDTRRIGSISARTSGRIDKLYVRYRYQKIRAGQKIMDLYSPEILTAEENLLFLLKNDTDNSSLTQATRQKLLLLGMSEGQLNRIVRTRQTELTIGLYSPYTGHIHEAGTPETNMPPPTGTMRDISLVTEELSLKEGMYVQKGQTILSVYDPDHAWAVLNFYSDRQTLVHVGNPVRLVAETAPQKEFGARIDFIEPFYRKEDKTLTARVYFDNTHLQIPIGSQVNATITGNVQSDDWLPETAIVSLGLDKIVFIKRDIGFKAHKVITGITYDHKVQVLGGLTASDTIAINAQYLMDSESFIKVKE